MSDKRSLLAFAEIMASGDAATLSIVDGLALLLDRESSYRNDAGTRAKVVAGFALGACLLNENSQSALRARGGWHPGCDTPN